jgi:hypothetical protein
VIASTDGPATASEPPNAPSSNRFFT